MTYSPYAHVGLSQNPCALERAQREYLDLCEHHGISPAKHEYQVLVSVNSTHFSDDETSIWTTVVGLVNGDDLEPPPEYWHWLSDQLALSKLEVERH